MHDFYYNRISMKRKRFPRGRGPAHLARLPARGTNEAARTVLRRRGAPTHSFIIGIDEAGRGPLAGPLVVAAVGGIHSRDLKGIRDSKKLSAQKREQWFTYLCHRGICRFASVSPGTIDKKGITRATREIIARLVRRFPLRPAKILLDGGISAPSHYIQKTIVKGDERIPLIAAASIIAKVARDRKMMKLHTQYPPYDFAVHKGYGTRLHLERLHKYGPSPIHRRSFSPVSLAASQFRVSIAISKEI